MRNAYIKTLYELTAENRNVCSLISDNGAIVFDEYAADFPKNLINCGIAEANMISLAAGLAACGKIPFAYTIAPFLTLRVCEHIRNDLCLQKMNVKLVAIGCGFVYSNLGPTHHGIEDIAVMRVMPGMTIFNPADAHEIRHAVKAAIDIEGPVYIRIGRNSVPYIYDHDDYDFCSGRAVFLREGEDLSLLGTGLSVSDCLEASRILDCSYGIKAGVLNFHTIKPFDRLAVLRAAVSSELLVTVEQNSIIGGLGSAVAEIMAEAGTGTKLLRLGLKDEFVSDYGSFEELKKIYKLDAASIVEQSLKALRG